LGHLHEPGLLQLPDGTFTSALAETRTTDDGLHVDVDETIGQRRNAQGQGGQVEVQQKRFQNDKARFAAFASCPSAP
jgi:hypothetical protein